MRPVSVVNTGILASSRPSAGASRPQRFARGDAGTAFRQSPSDSLPVLIGTFRPRP